MTGPTAEIVAKLSLLDRDILLQALAEALKAEPKPESGPRICSHCGFDLVSDRLIIRDGFVLDPRGRLYFGEHPILLSKVEFQIVATIMKGSGRTIEYSTLIERHCNAKRTSYQLLIRQHTHNIKAKFKRAEAPYPLRVDYGIGLFWKVDEET